jgi:predicted NUDIX family phosphoesterase
MAEEHILVIPRALFDELGAFHGLCTDHERYVATLLDPARNFFLPRGPTELDPTHKQFSTIAAKSCNMSVEKKGAKPACTPRPALASVAM